MADKLQIIENLGKVWEAFHFMEHELYADYVFDALELLKSQTPECVCESCQEFTCDGCPLEKRCAE